MHQSLRKNFSHRNHNYSLTSWMSLDWVLPVSNKPIVSLLPYTIIAFEMMVLLSAYGTIAGIIVLAFLETRKYTFPQSSKFKNYDRFTHDRFGLVVRCEKEELVKLEKIIKKHQPEEINRES